MPGTKGLTILDDINSKQPSPNQSMELTEILLAELVRYQPFTNCRKTVEHIIENAWNAGLLESLDPFSKVDPNLQRLKKA